VGGVAGCRCTVSERTKHSLTEVGVVEAPVRPRVVSLQVPPVVQPLLSGSRASSQNQFACDQVHWQPVSPRAPVVLGLFVLLLGVRKSGQEARNLLGEGLREEGWRRRERGAGRLSCSSRSVELGA